MIQILIWCLFAGSKCVEVNLNFFKFKSNMYITIEIYFQGKQL